MEKKELRKIIRQAKKEHTEEERRQMSEDICQQILSHDKIREAETILAYWSLPDEINTHDLVCRLWQQGRRVLLPKVISDTEMTLHEFHGMESMKEGAYGILEPTTPAISIPDDTCQWTAIVPGMSFSPDGYRLGRGKGYYDRLLSRIPYIYKIGICFPFQLSAEVPHDEYDVRMDEIVTYIFHTAKYFHKKLPKENAAPSCREDDAAER